jgi:hypothetical protein
MLSPHSVTLNCWHSEREYDITPMGAANHNGQQDPPSWVPRSHLLKCVDLSISTFRSSVPTVAAFTSNNCGIVNAAPLSARMDNPE